MASLDKLVHKLPSMLTNLTGGGGSRLIYRGNCESLRFTTGQEDVPTSPESRPWPRSWCVLLVIAGCLTIGMSRKRSSVAALATEAELDLDEALVLLWDAGLDELDEPNDLIADRDLATAKKALGLATARQLRSISYLARAAGLSTEEARRKLTEAKVISSKTADRLPRGGVKKARKILGLHTAAGFTRLMEEASGDETVATPTEPAFQWRQVGSVENIDYLVGDEVEKIHHALAEDFRESGDPITPSGCRDRNLLESAVLRPQTSIGDQLKYPTVAMAAAALFHSLALNHAFYNGNKRTALVGLLVFLDRNRYVLEVTESEIFKEVLLVAQHHVVRGTTRPHPDHEVLVIAEWVCKRMRRVRKEEFPLQWRDLRRVLTSYDCTFEAGSGGRMMITRPRSRGFFAGSRPLKTKIGYADDGRDADPFTIHKIRRDLQLDEEHGVDSEVFYRGRPVIDEFIAKYRKTLIRLAKL